MLQEIGLRYFSSRKAYDFYDENLKTTEMEIKIIILKGGLKGGLSCTYKGISNGAFRKLDF